MSKILILSLGRTGSLPVYAERICKEFSELDYLLVVSKNRFDKTVENSNIFEIKTYTDKVSFLLNTIFLYPIYFFKIFRKIKKLKINTLYLPYKHLWDLPIIFLFKLLNKRVIFTVHDGILHTGERNVFTQFQNKLRIRFATEYIFLTNYVKEKVYKEYQLHNPFYIVPHPIIENNFIDLIRKKETKNLLFLGRIDKYKGIELLINTIRNNNIVFDKLIIAGKSQYKLDFPELDDRIEIIDRYLSEQEMGAYLSWANLLVLPYTEATQSGVITLGIYAELPMVCTDVGGLSEQLTPDECFWCQPNENSLFKAVSEALSYSTKYDSIELKMKKKKEHLSWQNISAMIEKTVLSE